MSEKQLSFDCAMKIVNKQKWIQIKDIERLEKFIQNQQATISALKEENEQLREELNNLKKDETMLYHYYTLARYGGDGV